MKIKVTAAHIGSIDDKRYVSNCMLVKALKDFDGQDWDVGLNGACCKTHIMYFPKDMNFKILKWDRGEHVEPFEFEAKIYKRTDI